MQVTGRCYIYVDGVLLRSKSGAKLTGIGATERTAVVGHQVYGYSEKTVAPSVEATLADTGDLSLIAISQITDATVTFETDTGKTYVVRHAWCETPPDLAEGEGEVTLKLTGTTVEEQLA